MASLATATAGGIPINIRTRGEPNEYQNIGTLTNASMSNDVKPLYGRRTYRGSNEWNYYTLLNNHIQVKQAIEINSNNSTCVDLSKNSLILSYTCLKYVSFNFSLNNI